MQQVRSFDDRLIFLQHKRPKSRPLFPVWGDILSRRSSLADESKVKIEI